MKHIRWLTKNFPITFMVFILFSETVAGIQMPEINIGGMLLDEIYAGAFRTWQRSPTSLPDGIANYYADVALWVGYMTDGVEVVVAGDGNREVPSFPEWAWVEPLMVDSILSLQPDVEWAMKGAVSDRSGVPGNQESGIQVEITVLKPADISSVVIELRLTSESFLDLLYVGLKSDFDVPDDDGTYNPEDDLLQFVPGHEMFLLRNSGSADQTRVVGMANLGEGDVQFSAYLRPD